MAKLRGPKATRQRMRTCIRATPPVITIPSG